MWITRQFFNYLAVAGYDLLPIIKCDDNGHDEQLVLLEPGPGSDTGSA